MTKCAWVRQSFSRKTQPIPFDNTSPLQLGEGAFSVVKEGSHKQTGDAYAIKIVTKAKLTKEDEIALKDEIDILKDFRHPHIIMLYDVFDEPQYYYLVTEKMGGGELFDRIVQKSYYNEKEARDTCKIIFEAIKYCHDHHVAHRDLKPENLLLVGENDSDIKIADFGFAKVRTIWDCLSHMFQYRSILRLTLFYSSLYPTQRVTKPNSLTTQCGTPGYVAPEILEGVPYDQKADM